MAGRCDAVGRLPGIACGGSIRDSFGAAACVCAYVYAYAGAVSYSARPIADSDDTACAFPHRGTFTGIF